MSMKPEPRPFVEEPIGVRIQSQRIDRWIDCAEEAIRTTKSDLAIALLAKHVCLPLMRLREAAAVEVIVDNTDRTVARISAVVDRFGELKSLPSRPSASFRSSALAEQKSPHPSIKFWDMVREETAFHEQLPSLLYDLASSEREGPAIESLLAPNKRHTYLRVYVEQGVLGATALVLLSSQGKLALRIVA